MKKSQNKIEIKWEKSALDSHEAWALQIGIEFSFTHAQTYLAEIQAAEERISNHPFIGTEFKSPQRPLLRRNVTNSGYSVFYELDSSETRLSPLLYLSSGAKNNLVKSLKNSKLGYTYASHSNIKTTEGYAHLKPANHIPTIALENRKAPETEALKNGS